MSGRNTAVSVVSAVCPALTLVGVLVSPLGLRAQEVGSADLVTLEGEVVDASNNLPVEGAIVSFPDFGLNEVTDSLGYYRIREVPAGTHAIRVFRLGYEEFEVEVTLNGAEVRLASGVSHPQLFPRDFRGGTRLQ